MLTVVVKNNSILSFLVFAMGGRIVNQSIASHGEIVATLEDIRERYLVYDLYRAIPDFLHFTFGR